MTGTVTATRVDGTSVELKVGDVVHEGDIITTAPASTVGLTFSDQTVLSLSESSRIVLDQYSFSAEGTVQSSNSMLVNVIEGTFVFIAGLIAPSGKMRVETPVASMGIRGTTGVIEVEAKDGATGFKLINDPDGGVGHFDLYNKKSGELIRAFTEPGDSILVRNAGGETSDFNAALDASQKSAVSQAFTAYSLGQARIDRGDDPVGNPTGPNGAPPPPTPGAPRRGDIDGMQRHAGLMPVQPLIALLPEVTFDPESGEQIFLLTDAERPPLLLGTFITSAPEALVIEAGLPVTGSNPASPGESFTGALTSTGGRGGYTYEIVGSGTGLYGTLELKSDGTYTYTLLTPIQDQGGNDGANVQVGAEVFTYRVTDANGNTVTGQIVVTITDDAPIARADTKSVIEGGVVTGNVLTDGTADAFGADGAASGGGIVGVRAAGGDLTTAAIANVGSVITGLYGNLILNANGSYTYDGNPDAVPTSGATDTFVYTIEDGDGDLATTTLTVTLSDSGLAAVTDIDAQVSEAALPTGSNPSSTAETDAINTLAGSVTGGTGPYTYALVGSGTGTYGTITLNATSGEYTYTLTKAAINTGANEGSAADSFTYRATDANGNTVTGQIVVTITDDAPIARADTKSVIEGGVVTGNVLTDGTADAFGADGAASGGGIVGVRAAGGDLTTAAIANVGSVITGLYGNLILNANGSYTYDGNPDAVPTSGATDTFVYTIEDGDGDLATTTLTVTLSDSGLAAVTDIDAQVSEAALPTGSNPSSTAETDAINTLAGSVTGGTGRGRRVRLAVPRAPPRLPVHALPGQPGPDAADQRAVQHDADRHGDLLQGHADRGRARDDAAEQRVRHRAGTHGEDLQARVPGLRSAHHLRRTGLRRGEEDHVA